MPAASRTPPVPRRLKSLLLLLALIVTAGLWRISQTASVTQRHIDPAMAQGLALLSKGQARGAAAAFAEAARRHPDDPDAAYLTGLAWFRAGELRPAAAALRQSVSLRPGFVEGHRRLGQIYTMAREYSLAAASLERARALAPDDATTWIQLGRLYLTIGESRRAEAALSQAVRLRPDSGGAHALLGEAERQAGPADWQAAGREFRRALTLDPTNADAHHRLGWLALRAGRPDQALPQLRAAVRLDPQLAGAWYLLGQAAQRAGRRHEARRAFAAFQQCSLHTPEDGE